MTNLFQYFLFLLKKKKKNNRKTHDRTEKTQPPSQAENSGHEHDAEPGNLVGLSGLSLSRDETEGILQTFESVLNFDLFFLP